MSRTIEIRDGKQRLNKSQQRVLQHAADLLVGLQIAHRQDESKVTNLIDAEDVIREEIKDDSEDVAE